MINKKHQGLKEKRQFAHLRVIATLIGGTFLLLTAHYFLFVAFILLLFVLNELFLADHLFYDPKSDYQYEFGEVERLDPVWLDSRFVLDLQAVGVGFDTALLAIQVKSTLSGYFLDPFVTIRVGEFVRQQYFERSLDGLRYLNLSEFLGLGEQLEIESNHCQLVRENSELIVFSNPGLEGKRVLVIAPHADDAEIAAFGLYSSNNSSIVTITAGEVEPREYKAFYTDSEKAALFKGRLRAWDSIAVPLWGGVESEETIQLGYFCLCLKAMHDAPDQLVKSKAADVRDTRLFRQFNQAKLESDNNGEPTWNSLVGDLVECIERIKPDLIVTPHPELDPHEDHYYSTVALSQALKKANHSVADLYFYANHLVYSDQFPFGPVHTVASLPPNVGRPLAVESVASMPLTLRQQKDKAAALAMMHDLQPSLRWKKQFRFKLQALFLGRQQSPYGADEYFRKAIRANELFFRTRVENFLSKNDV